MRALDTVLPRWHFRERHATPVPADLPLGTAEMEAATWGDVPLFRTLVVLSSLGRTVPSPDRPILADLTGGGFRVLARTDRELVVGAVVPVTRAVGRPEPTADAGTFRDFRRPGHYKVALDLRRDGGRLTTETRVVCTDRAARVRFGGYWALVRLPGGLLRRQWLRGIHRRARALHRSTRGS